MNTEMEKELEIEISRALQGLPDLAAPPGFLARTMGALEQPSPWRLQPWTGWPLFARIAFLVVALGAAAAAVEGWRVVGPGLLAEASHRLAPAVASLASFWNVLSGLAGALTLAAEQLSKGFMLACLVAAAGACAVCAGFGTIFVRLALAGPRKNQL
jgi:hypothetical protein